MPMLCLPGLHSEAGALQQPRMEVNAAQFSQVWAARALPQDSSLLARRGPAKSPGPHMDHRGSFGCWAHPVPTLQQAVGPFQGENRHPGSNDQQLRFLIQNRSRYALEHLLV